LILFWQTGTAKIQLSNLYQAKYIIQFVSPHLIKLIHVIQDQKNVSFTAKTST